MTANEPELASEHSVDEPETTADRPHRSLAAPEEKFQREKRSRRTEVDKDHRESNHLMESLPPSPSNEPVLPMPVDKSMLTLNEPRRYRNRAHLEFVAAQPCLICERRPSDAHHLRFAQPSALGRRVSDEFTVPLCRSHHRALHRRGNEAEWWKEIGIDPVGIAQKLWGQTRFGKMAANRSVPF